MIAIFIPLPSVYIYDHCYFSVCIYLKSFIPTKCLVSPIYVILELTIPLKSKDVTVLN
jgi:hypothetical protein